MSDFKQTWSEIADRSESLGLKLKLHGEQTSGAEVPEALSHHGPASPRMALSRYSSGR